MDLGRELAALHAQSFGWALACCARDEARAADVLQQAYWKVLEGRARFDGRSALKTWFFGVVRLTALEQQRSILRWLGRGGTSGPANEDDVAAPSSAKPDERAAKKQAALRMSRALASLAPRQREVLHLVFYEDLSIAEAAVIMDVSLGSARQHYDRGKKHLLEILTRDGDRR